MEVIAETKTAPAEISLASLASGWISGIAISTTYSIEVEYEQKITRTATFYYNNNSTCGSQTIATTTETCEASASSPSCDISIPEVVKKIDIDNKMIIVKLLDGLI